MLGRFLTIGTFFTLGFLSAAPIRAQESSWGIRPFAEGGWSFPLMNMGKNSVNVESAGNVQLSTAMQTVATMESSQVMGAGVDAIFPAGNMRIRGEFRTTVGATARALLGLCESRKLASPGLGLCDDVERVDARVTEGDVSLVLSLGHASQPIRPLVWLGVGVRNYQFDSDLSVCGTATTDASEICRQSREIFENPSVNALFTFGTGLEAFLDPVSAFVRLSAASSSYSGGIESADGGRQLDLVLTGGLGFRVR